MSLPTKKAGRPGGYNRPGAPPDLIALGKPDNSRFMSEPPLLKKSSTFHGTSSVSPHHSCASPTIPEPTINVIECAPHDLLRKVLDASGDPTTIDGLICGAIRTLKVNRSKPDQVVMYSLMVLGRKQPSLFRREVVVESLAGLLKKEIGLDYSKSKGHTCVAVLACNLIFVGFEQNSNWPSLLVKVLVEDSLGDRVWVDHPHCKKFVMNINTAFDTVPIPPDQKTESIEDIPMENGKNGFPNRFTLSTELPRLYAYDMVRERVSRRQGTISAQDATGSASGQHLLKTLTAMCGMSDVRLLAAQKLEMWLQNPKLTKATQDLLLSVCLNCRDHNQNDVDVIGLLTKIRFKSKSLLSHYIHALKALIDAHKDSITTLFNYIVYNELSSARSPTNMSVLAALMQHKPYAAAETLATVYQDLLLQQDDYLRAVRALLREIIRQAKYEVHFSAFALGIMKAPDTEKFSLLDQQHKDRFVSSVTDLVCLVMLASISPIIKESISVVVNGKPPPSDADYESLYYNHKLEIAALQRDAVWWLHTTVVPTLLPRMTNQEFMECLHKILFLKQPDTYYMKDNWPPDSDRNMMLKHCTDVPVLEDTLLRLAVIGSSSNHPLVPADALELIGKLVRRAGLLGRADFNPIPVERTEFIDALLSLSQYHHPENIKLPSEYVPPSLAISVLFWSVWQTLLAVCSFNPNSIGILAWNEYPTLRNYMEMAIINSFAFPIATVTDDNERSQIIGKEMQMVEMEKNEILEFESHLAAATTQISVTESSSLLLSQLIAMDSKGPLRRPPDHILSQVRNLCSQIQVGANLCRSRSPDFLLSIIERYGEDQEMPWLSGLVGSVRGDLNVLPVQCLCEFLMASNVDEEKHAQRDEILQQIRKNLQGQDTTQSWQAINYFLRRLHSTQCDTRSRAKVALSQILDHSSDGMDVDRPPDQTSLDRYSWLSRSLPALESYKIMRGKVLDAIVEAMKWETNEAALVAYVSFLSNDLDETMNDTSDDSTSCASKFALSIGHLLIDRQHFIKGIFQGVITGKELGPTLLNSLLKIMVRHLKSAKAESPGNGDAAKTLDEIPWRDTQDEIFLRWPGMEHAQLHIFVTQSMILLLTYGLPSAVTGIADKMCDDLYMDLLNSWFDEGGNIVPKAYLMDTQEEALLLPDWLKQRMLHCEVTGPSSRLPNAASCDLDVEQLVVFIQSFGMPYITMDHLLLRLDKVCSSSPDTLRKLITDNTSYLIRVVEGQWKRGCCNGTDFLSFLNVEKAMLRPSVIQSAATSCAEVVDLTLEPSEESDVMIISSPERPDHDIDMEVSAEDNISNILQDIFIASSSKPNHRNSGMFNRLLRSLTWSKGRNISTLTSCISEIQALVSAKKTGSTFLCGLYEHASKTCTLLRKLQFPFKLRMQGKDSISKSRKMFDKLTTTIRSRAPTNVSHKNQLVLLLQSWNVPKKLAESTDESLDWGRLEEFLRKQLAFLDKDAEIKNKVALVAQILLEEIGSRKMKMNRGKSDPQDDSFYASVGSTGLLIDWLQLLDPELLAHRPELQRKLLFESTRHTQTSLPIKFSAKKSATKLPQSTSSHQTYLLALITEHSNWDTVYKCLKWLLSDATCDPVLDKDKQKSSVVVDARTAMDFFWVCMHVSKIWKGRENKSNCLQDPVFYLSSVEFCHVLSYMVAASSKQANVATSKTGWDDTSYFELLLIFYTRFGQRQRRVENLEDTVKFLYAKAIDSTSNLWWKLLAQIHILEPIHQIWNSPLSSHGESLKENYTLAEMTSSIEVGSICHTDALIQLLLDRIGYVKESGRIDGREAVSVIQSDIDSAYDASLLLKQFASNNPSVVLRQLPLMVAELTGRTWYEFREFKAKNHLLFITQLVGVLDAIGHDQLFSEEYSNDVDKIFEIYFQALSNYTTKARRQMRDVVYDTLKLSYVFLQKKPSRAYKVMASYTQMLHMFMDRTYSDHENIVLLLSKILKLLESVSYSHCGSDGNPLSIHPEAIEAFDQTNQWIKMFAKNSDLENYAQLLSDLNDTKRRFFNQEPFLPQLTELIVTCNDSSVRHSALSTAVTCMRVSPSRTFPHVYPAYLSCLAGRHAPMLNSHTSINGANGLECKSGLIGNSTVDRDDLARTALDFLPEVSVLCGEKAPEILDAAFVCGSRDGVGVLPPGSQGELGTPLAIGGSSSWQDLSELLSKSLTLLSGITQNNAKSAPV